MDWRSIITGRSGRVALGVFAAAAVMPAAASAATGEPASFLPAATASCATPTFSQAFSGWGGQNWYTLAQQVQLTYHATGTRSFYQLHDLYIDPRCA